MVNEQLDQYVPAIYRFAVYMLRDHHAAQDVTQETMLRAWKRRDEFARLRQPKAWLLRVGANLCRDYIRKAASPIHNAQPLFEEPTGSAPEPWFGLIQEENCTRLEQTIRALSARERSVLYLSAFEQLRNPEIAEVLQLSVGSVKVALSRARSSVREVIQQAKKQENQP